MRKRSRHYPASIASGSVILTFRYRSACPASSARRSSLTLLLALPPPLPSMASLWVVWYLRFSRESSCTRRVSTSSAIQATFGCCTTLLRKPSASSAKAALPRRQERSHESDGKQSGQRCTTLGDQLHRARLKLNHDLVGV